MIPSDSAGVCTVLYPRAAYAGTDFNADRPPLPAAASFARIKTTDIVGILPAEQENNRYGKADTKQLP